MHTEDVNEIERFYRSKLESYTVEPPDHLWEKIQVRYQRELHNTKLSKIYKMAAGISLGISAIAVFSIMILKKSTTENRNELFSDSVTTASTDTNTYRNTDNIQKNTPLESVENKQSKKSQISNRRNTVRKMYIKTNNTASEQPIVTESNSVVEENTTEAMKDKEDATLTKDNKNHKEKSANSIKDKYKEQYKDSLSKNPLFVPEKK
ncbi:MAG: hypothetical protein NZ529_00095 [Cytophagaceae bacterium]|nr:hypothetical protein [Cytophagaceae bacterium]MDW8455166.1 hypothetical protein [Cytophagaceae bacterium]